MKKVILGVLFGMAAAGNVMAADAGAVINSGTPIDTTAATGCSLLSEQVTINLSNGVFGSYACNTVANVIGVAACHPTGRKGDVSVPCDPVATAETAPGAGDAYTPPAGCALRANPANANDGVMTVRGGLAFTASSRGGRVQGASAANCVTGGNATAEAQDAALL